MSKTEGLARRLEIGGLQAPGNAHVAAHLRALDASHQRLKEECEAMANYIDALGGDSKKYRAALEHAKDLE